MAEQWKQPEQDKEIPPHVFELSSDSTEFPKYYDEIQDTLKAIAGIDEVMSGVYVHIISRFNHIPYTAKLSRGKTFAVFAVFSQSQ